MKIGFMIINYNDAQTTRTLLENIKNYSCIDQILVVDNASTDNSLELLTQFEASNYRVFSAPSNKGYGAGINLGIQELEKEGISYCFISNSDIIISKEEDLKQLIADAQKGYAIVGPCINQHGQISRGWKIPTPMQELLQSLPLISTHIQKKYSYPESYYEQPLVPVEVVSGCFFLLHIPALKEVGYFDEKVFLYYEENILGSKLKRSHKKTVLDPQVVIFHNHSVTIDRALNRKRKYKTLSTSRRYFEAHYNDANRFYQFLFLVIEKLMLFGYSLKR